MISSKQKRKQFSLKQKLEILNEIYAGKSTSEVAKQFDLAKSTLATMLKDREKITLLAEHSLVGQDRKRLRLGNHQEIDAIVVKWLKDLQDRRIPVTGPMIQKEAISAARLLGIENFEASSGWLFRFRKRNGIEWKPLPESAAGSSETWQESKLREIVTRYEADDIFNAVETSFFYQMLPTTMTSFKDELCDDGKHSKIRISALFCCNATGTTKCQPFVVGCHTNPASLRDVKTLPCEYRSNKRSWFTSDLFVEWLGQLNAEMVKKNRNIVLIVSETPVHLVAINLSNVRLEFLPAQCLLRLEPLTQGIISDVKANYRRRQLQKFLINLNVGLQTTIDIKEALEMITGSWRSVKPCFIQNCWWKAGFFKKRDNSAATNDSRDVSDGELWNRVISSFNVPAHLTFRDFVNCDAHVTTSADLTPEIILSSVCKETSDDESDDEIDSSWSCVPTPSSDELISSLNNIKQFLNLQECLPESVRSSIDEVEDFITSKLSSAIVQKGKDHEEKFDLDNEILP